LAVKSLIPRGSHVFDVGCNCGQFGRNLQVELGCKITGVDLNPDYIRYCRQHWAGKYHALDFGGSLAGTALSCQEFEVITCLEVIEHPINVPGFLHNFHRLLSDDGILIITTPASTKFFGDWYHGRIEHHHVKLWTKDDLVAEFGAVGLEMIHHEYWEHEGEPTNHIAVFKRRRDEVEEG